MRRRGLLLLAAVAGCGPPGAIVVRIDAAPAVHASLESIDIAIGGGSSAVDHLAFPVENVAPNCLPRTFGVTRDSANTLTLDIVGSLRNGQQLNQHVDAAFESGLRRLDLLLDERCLGADDCLPIDLDTLPESDMDDVDVMVRREVCRVVETPGACVEGGGCFDRADPFTPLCVTPCPEPARPDAPDRPTPPTPPQPPVFTPCPAGWIESPDATCAPWPAGATCPAGTIRFPGDTACAPLDTCASEWPTNLPADAIYVRAGSAGDGSRAAPYGTLDEALGVVLDAGTIVLARGSHLVVGTVRVERPVILIGACATETAIVGGAIALAAAVRVESIRFEQPVGAIDATVSLENTIADGGFIGMDSMLEGTQVVARSLDLTGGSSNFDRLVVRGGSINLTNSALAATDLAHDDGAVHVDGGSRFAIQRGVFENGTGLRSQGTVVGMDIVVRRMAAGAIHVQAGHLDLTRTTIDDVPGYGIKLTGGTATVAHTQISDVVPFGSDAVGLQVSDATLSGHHLAIVRPPAYGMRVHGGTVTVEDLSIRDASGNVGGEGGLGVWSETSSLTLTRVAILNARRYGILIEEGGSTFDDLRIFQTHPDRRDGDRGVGLYAYRGAVVAATRVSVEKSRDTGIRARAIDPRGVRLDLVDVSVTDTSTSGGDRMSLDRGFGLRVDGRVAAAASIVTVLRGAFLRNRAANIALFGGDVTLEHVVVADGRPTLGESKLGGYGLRVETNTKLFGRRIHAINNRDVGLILSGPASDVTLEEIIVQDTVEPRDTPGPNLAGGGLASGFDATVNVTGLWIKDNTGPGVRLYREGELDLTDGLIERNTSGALVQNADYNLQRLTVGVVYRDNPSAIISDTE